MSENLKLFDFENLYARLPERFYHRQSPVPVERPRLVALNAELAEQLGMPAERVDPDRLADVFAGNEVPDGADPLAMAYAGHQFGRFVPQLGDGRAILLGEVRGIHGGRKDVQLKGSGRTPFSRGGDGRAALGPVIREYIVSEAMHALGIPTTRSLAAVTTGEPVYRERPLPGAVLTRVAASHIRIGTFEYFAARGDTEAVRLLADHVIDRHYPGAKAADDPYHALLESVLEAQAALVAQWMHVGFIHGVMNTDNMALSGETIDYGPCAFMDHYEPMMVFSSIDTYGRYAFGNQSRIAQWNLARLAETLVPIREGDSNENDAIADAEALLKTFPDRFHQHWMDGIRQKLGLRTEQDDDASLIDELFGLMHASGADFTVTFRLLCDAAEGDDDALRQELSDPQKADRWLSGWRERLQREPQVADRAQRMRQTNPAYIPRNHRIEEVIEAAVQREDYSPMERLQQVLANPYQEQAGREEYALPPKPSERIRATFCGT